MPLQRGAVEEPAAVDLEAMAAVRAARTTLNMAVSTPPADVARGFQLTDTTMALLDFVRRSDGDEDAPRVHDMIPEEPAGPYRVYTRRAANVKRRQARLKATKADQSEQLRDLGRMLAANRAAFSRQR